MSDDNMSDEITIRPQSESASTPATAGSKDSTASSIGTQLTSLCALGLGVSFFLPWVHILFTGVSGFDMQKDHNAQLLLWFIPVFCGLTIISGLANSGQHIVARLTGLLPFAVGIYWLTKIGSDLFHILAYGAYLSLGFGLLLLILPQKSK